MTQNVRDIPAIEVLIELLKIKVGSAVSYSNLARTLEKDVKTIKRWLQILEDIYVIFRVTPYSTKIARSLLKEPKYYFYDSTQIVNNDGAKLENFVASALLKEIHFVEDILGKKASLHFVRTKDGREVDFLVVIDSKPAYFIEAKLSDDDPNRNFSYFARYLPLGIKKIQLVKNLRREKTYADGLEVRSLVSWLTDINFSA